MASRLCDIAGPFEVLMPTMQLERLPEGVTATHTARSSCAGSPARSTWSSSTAPGARPLNDTGELWTRTPFG